MDETKSISPEVKGLFETIKQQAKQYEEAFIFFENERKKMERFREELENYLNLIKSQADEVFVNLSRGVYDTLSALESKSDKINKIYDELENIKEIKNQLLNFQEAIKKYSLELESSVPTMKAKAESEISSTLYQIRTQAEKEIENELQKMEVRIGLRFKNIETKLFNYDQKLLSLTDYQGREFRTLSEEIDALKTKINSIKLLVDDSRRHLEKFTKEIEQNINDKIIYIEQLSQNIDRIQQIPNVPMDFLSTSSAGTSSQKSEQSFDFIMFVDSYKKEWKQITEKYAKMERKIEELIKKNNTTFYLVIGAIILALITLVVAIAL